MPSKNPAIVDKFPVPTSKDDIPTSPKLPSDALINLDHGDPVAFEPYWKMMGAKCNITFEGNQSLSYFSNPKNLCWFLEPKLEEEIRRVHNVVGNAVVDGYYIIVGTGSSQLLQAALYALTDGVETAPTSVVAAAPFYSAYPEITDFLRSGLFKWAGDANEYDGNAPYVEFVTSPNNPDGFIRESVVNQGSQGKLIHDLAYYWPHYTSISAPANNDIMLFTFSKCTGHAGSRIGWALVKEKEVAQKMIKFMEVTTIGVAKESQLRAAKIIGAISDGCETAHVSSDVPNFFQYAQDVMTQRWERLRDVIKESETFTLSKYPPKYCNFFKDFTETHPGFAWLKIEKDEEDLQKLLRGKNILARSGTRFGSQKCFVRISMLGKDEEIDLLIRRLKELKGLNNQDN